MKFFNLYKIKHYKFNSSVNEWVNSIYKFNKYDINTFLKTKTLDNIFNIYFNFNNISDRYTIKRVFIGTSDIKHSIDNIIINVYVFNKEKIYYLNKIKLLNINKKLNLLENIKCKKLKIFKINYKYLYNSLNLNLRKNLYLSFLYKFYISKLFFNNFKFNIININNLNNLLTNIFRKKIIFNIINIKYLHLDNSLLVDAITRKLRDRNKKALRVLKKGLALSKIPVIHPLLLLRGKNTTNEINNFNYKNIFNEIDNIRNNIIEHMKNTHIIGVRLEGKGRLTKRLTASRSVYKKIYKGTLNNIYSSMQGYSSVLCKGFQKSSVDYINKNSYNRNGSYGIKGYNNTF